MWDAFDILSVAVRWIHATAAVVWIGGSAFYLLVLRPAVKDAAKTGNPIDGRFNALAAAHFREWVHLSMVVLLVSGAILTFDRLTEQSISGMYITTLVIKIALSFWLFGIGMAYYRRRGTQKGAVVIQGGVTKKARFRRWAYPFISPYTVVYGGLLAVLLSDILKIAFEKDIS